MIKVPRGNKLLKLVDKIIGKFLVFILCGIKFSRFFISKVKYEKSNPSCIAICCYGAIGDLLLISESIAYLKARERNLKVILFCTVSNKAVADLYSNIYDSVHVVSLTSLNPLTRVVQLESVETVFDCNQWANISVVHCLMLKIISPKIITKGFSRHSFFNLYDKSVAHLSSVHEFVNYYNLLADKSYNNDCLPILLPRLFEKNHRKSLRKVLIHMWPSGIRSYLKEWPEGHWLELCQRLSADGYKLYFSGSPSDVEKNKLFINKLKNVNCFDLAGQKSLFDLSEFLSSEVSVCVSVNTGVMHLAYLAGASVVALNGPTNPTRWGAIGCNSVSLLPDKGNFAYLNYGFEYPDDDESAYALHFLSVDKVFDAIQGIH